MTLYHTMTDLQVGFDSVGASVAVISVFTNSPNESEARVTTDRLSLRDLFLMLVPDFRSTLIGD
jgi:hypothetical protein